jgi:hypothetical protein
MRLSRHNYFKLPAILLRRLVVGVSPRQGPGNRRAGAPIPPSAGEDEDVRQPQHPINVETARVSTYKLYWPPCDDEVIIGFLTD